MQQQSKIMLNALQALISPIARFCVKRSIKFNDFIDASKQAFLQAATAELESDENSHSISKISVITGIHRREVKRIQSNDSEKNEDNNLLSRVLSLWRESKKFTSSSKKPRPLQYEGKESEFVDLVRSVSSDLNPYTVLFELERVGAVERSIQGLKLKSPVYIPAGNIKQGLKLLSNDMSDLLAGVSENIFDNPEIPNLHIKTEFDNISESDLVKIKTWLLEQGTDFHNKAQSYLAKFDYDTSPRKNKNYSRIRIALASFVNVEKTK